MRFAQTQVWPALRYLLAIAPSTAASMSASSNTMNGALPPSSSESFLIVGALCGIRMRPTSVEPVKLTVAHESLAHEHLADLRSSASPVTHVEHARRHAGALRQLGAAPAPRAASASAGLTTTVQPAASAGATLRVIIAIGKFHGVIAAHTPIGCLMHDACACRRRCVGMVSP